MKSGTTQDRRLSMKLAAGSVIVDAQSQSSIKGLILSHGGPQSRVETPGV